MEKVNKSINDRDIEKIVEEILLNINSKKYAINEFKEKYLNQSFYSTHINNYKERKDYITIKINDINKILDLYYQTISLSTKAIVFLYIKNKTSNSSNYKYIFNRFINNQDFNNNNINSNSFNGNNKQLKIKDDNKSKYNIDSKSNLTKNNNKSYFNQIITKDGIKINKIYNRQFTNLKKKNLNNLKKRIIIDDNNLKEKNNNKTDLVLNSSKNKINSNFNNYIKNFQETDTIQKNNNYFSYYLRNDLTPQIFLKNKKYYYDIDNKKCEFIKIKNFKYKIKSPLRQTLRDMVKRQKIKGKIFNSTSNYLKKSKKKIMTTSMSKEEYKEDMISSPLYDKTKFNNFKLFFAEKYGGGSYNNFLNKYKTNKINRLMIENELEILSKMVNNNNNNNYSYKNVTEKINNKNSKNNIGNIYLKTCERLFLNFTRKKNFQKECSFKTPKTQECYRRIIHESTQRTNNSLKTLNNKTFSSLRYSKVGSNKRIIYTVDQNDKTN